MSVPSLLYLLTLTTSVLSLTLPLHNGIYSSAGGYTVSIQLGTPPQTFQVQIDTGSGKLAVPCKECTQCQQNPNKPFDYTRSSSYQAATCSSGGNFCDECIANTQGESKCLLDVSFLDGGWLKGNMATDLFSAAGLTQPIVTTFGCASQASNDFLSDTAIDGIWGVGKSASGQNGEAQRLDQLISAISGLSNSPRQIALCLALEGGFMNIGTIDFSLHTQPGVVIPYDTPSGDTISSSLSTISLGGTVLTTQGGAELPQLIIDSGSTTSSLSQNLYQQLVSNLEGICRQMGEQGCQAQQDENSKTCFNISDFSLFSMFPPIAFTFTGGQVDWHAEEYLTTEDETNYCLTFVPGKEQGSHLLGDDFMLNKDIVFGESAITIYQQSRCSGQVVSYQYGPNQPQGQLLSSEGTVVQKEGTTGRVLLALGMTVILIIFIAVVVYVFRSCSRTEEAKETKSTNPEEIDDGVGTDVRFNQEMMEKGSAEGK